MPHVVRWNSRWLLYLLVFGAPLIALQVAGAYISITARPSTASSIATTQITFAVLSTILSLTLYLTVHAFQEERTFVKEFVGEDELVPLYQRIRTEAVSECLMSWLTSYKITDLQAYFRKEVEFMEKAEGKSFRRLIAATKTGLTPDEILAHFDATAHLRTPGRQKRLRYDCRVTFAEGIEMVYADFHADGRTCHRGLLIAAEGDEKVGFYFEDRAKATTEDLADSQRVAVAAMRSFYLSEWERALPEEAYRALLVGTRRAGVIPQNPAPDGVA